MLMFLIGYVIALEKILRRGKKDNLNEDLLSCIWLKIILDIIVKTGLLRSILNILRQMC